MALLTNYVTVIENRPMMSAKYCLPVPVCHIWPKLTHSAARSLCYSWVTCFDSHGIFINREWSHNAVIETLDFLQKANFLWSVKYDSRKYTVWVH